MFSVEHDRDHPFQFTSPFQYSPLLYLNILPGTKAIRSISGCMKAAPAGGMDVGDMMTGPLKASGLPMGVA